jgi:hypothetical protein
MNLREAAEAERVTRASRLAATCQPIERAASAWLASYPLFEDALRYGETTFRMLPEYAKRVALNRTSIDAAEQATESRILDELNVSLVELSTHSVDEAVKSYLGGHAEGLRSDRRATSLDDLVEEISAMNYPLIARPPCLLRPGHRVFLDGWMRFFSYRARGDLTIPLLAIDWLDFHYRLNASTASRSIKISTSDSKSVVSLT